MFINTTNSPTTIISSNLFADNSVSDFGLNLTRTIVFGFSSILINCYFDNFDGFFFIHTISVYKLVWETDLWLELIAAPATFILIFGHKGSWRLFPNCLSDKYSSLIYHIFITLNIYHILLPDCRLLGII